MKTETIYVALLDEGIDVWRPVEALEVAEGMFQIIGAPEDETETWQFQTGSVVRCRFRTFDGTNQLVAYELAHE